jgi:hypothetical protein
MMKAAEMNASERNIPFVWVLKFDEVKKPANYTRQLMQGLEVELR